MATNSIVAKVWGSMPRVEAEAAAAVKPGSLLAYNSSGKFIANAVAGKGCLNLVLVEQGLQGQTIDDESVVGEVAQAQIMRPGDEYYVRLADGQNVAIGDVLASSGAGTLKKAAKTTDSAGDITADDAVIAVALEALDMSDSTAADPVNLVKVIAV